MAEQRWRKFPVNSLYNTRIQFIVKRLPKELKHAAFTLLSSCYCNADDDGVVDMTDFEIYADGIFLEPEELRILIDKLCGAGILHRFASDIDIYAIADWELPEYKNANKRESLNERRQRIAKWSDTPTACYPPLQNDKNENFVTQNFIATKNENLLHSQEREIEIEIERETERTELEENRQEEKKKRTEKKERQTHRKEADTANSNLQANACCVAVDAVSPEEIKTEKLEKKQKKQKKQQEPEEKRLVEGSGESAMSTEKVTLPLQSKGNEEKVERGRSFNPAKHLDLFLAVQERFFEEGIVHFPDQNKEIEAMKEIAIRALILCNDKNVPNTVGNLFVSRFKALLEAGKNTQGFEYFKSMPFLPSTMLTSACWNRIFISVQHILYPHNTPTEWEKRQKQDRELILQQRADGTIDNYIESVCEKAGVSLDDPQALSKAFLRSVKK